MNLENYEHFLSSFNESSSSPWKSELHSKLDAVFTKPSHGHFPNWLSATNQLPKSRTNHFDFTKPIIEVGLADELNLQDHAVALQALNELHPWRKGPFNFFGTLIDSEWRCDKKWQRISTHIPSLENKLVLDVGCGNGYYMLRMLGDGAKSVVGVDPTLLFLAQFYAMTKCINQKIPACLVPLAFEDLPPNLNYFDYVFSMGVLYHRRKPKEHLRRLFHHTVPGGKIFIETLILDQAGTTELIPEDRYAGMRNVWSIPSYSLVLNWLQECGYENLTLHNIHKTSTEEQRATSWMQNYSLVNFLDPDNSSKTIEGYPAPTRAIFSATRP